jgi:hypothetical protein
MQRRQRNGHNQKEAKDGSNIVNWPGQIKEHSTSLYLAVAKWEYCNQFPFFFTKN